MKSSLAALAIAGSAMGALAQNTNPTNTFDAAPSTASFVQWWGTATMTWDGTKDAANDPLSGSVHYSAPFVGAGGEQFMTHNTIANRWGWDGGYILDATTYTNFSFDIKVDPASPLTPGGNYGNLEVGYTVNGWGTTYLPTYVIPASATNWTHVDRPLNPAMGNINIVVGSFFKLWSNGAHTNTLIFNIDNVKFTKPTVAAVIPPPTVSLEKSVPGLRQFADAEPNYNRQDLRTDLNAPGSKDIDWIGHPGATYSFTVAEFPGAGTPNFQAAFTLTPDDPTTMTYADPDWSATNCLWLQIQGNNNGSVRTSLSWKTNQPAGNTQLYGSGVLLANFNTPTAIGTWSLSFPNNTSVTLTAPGGASTNLTLPADMFVVPYTGVSAFLGSGMNNNVALIGKSVTFSSFQVANVLNSFNENLNDGSLSTPFLILQSQGYGANPAPINQIFVTSADAYWLRWSLPDTGFFAEHKDTLTNPTWSGYTPASTLLNGSGRWAKVPAASLASLNSGYFRLIKRPFTKLQVLMPGETAAPNTPTGKTGTPNDQTAGLPFNMTVRAVDAVWNLVSSSDTVNLTSTDGTATLPANAALVVGTATMTVTFGSSGTFTLTATDVTDPTKTANTGSPTLVP